MQRQPPRNEEIWRGPPATQERSVRRGAPSNSLYTLYKVRVCSDEDYLEVAHHDQTDGVGTAAHQSAGVDPTLMAVLDHLGVAQKAHHHHCRRKRCVLQTEAQISTIICFYYTPWNKITPVTLMIWERENLEPFFMMCQ